MTNKEMVVERVDRGILSDAHRDKREKLLAMLEKAYWMEIETVMSYLSNSVNLDGVQAQEVIEALESDVQEELQHAQNFAGRIKELWGVVPGSQEFQPEQDYLQPCKDLTDLLHVIRGVIAAEQGAISHYNRIIQFCDQLDPVTQDMTIEILRDEERHLRLFQGFLRGLTGERA